MLRLFASVLAEQKIIFTSKYFTMLTIAAETITQLLLPFRWHHIFIPILPRELLGFVEAPTPYIIGVDSKYKAEISNISGTTLVDLDTGTIDTSEVPTPLSRSQNLPNSSPHIQATFQGCLHTLCSVSTDCYSHNGSPSSPISTELRSLLTSPSVA